MAKGVSVDSDTGRLIQRFSDYWRSCLAVCCAMCRFLRLARHLCVPLCLPTLGSIVPLQVGVALLETTKPSRRNPQRLVVSSAPLELPFGNRTCSNFTDISLFQEDAMSVRQNWGATSKLDAAKIRTNF